MNNESKKRGKKTNLEQMTLLLNYLEGNRLLITGKTNPNSVEEIENLWDDLVSILNEVPNGAKKDKKQWKNFLTEWKSKTQKKARIAKRNQTMTGGGPSDADNLSDIEIRLIKLIGWVTVTGCVDLAPEINPETVETDQNMSIDNEFHEAAVEIVYENVLSDENDISLIEPEIQQTTSSIEQPKLNVKSKKTTKKLRQSSQLEKSAELYAKSAEQMAEAIKEMALSISKFAEALSAMATAIANKNMGLL